MHIDSDSYLNSPAPFLEQSEHRLWFAVLIEAIKDQDHMWLVTDGYEGSYDWVCRVLDIDAAKLRIGIRKAWLTSSVDFNLLSPGKFEDYVTLTPERKQQIVEGRSKRIANKKDTCFKRKVEAPSIYCQLGLFE